MVSSTIRRGLTLAATIALLLTLALPIAAQAQSSLPVTLSSGKSFQSPSVTASSNPPVKLPFAKGQKGTSATASNVTISSTTGWQQTALTVQQGAQFTVSYVSGTWTVDYTNFPYVGPDGYSQDIDNQINPACKDDTSLVYATLLGQVGNGSEFRVGPGGTFTADAGGTLSLRINDDCLSDNAGSVTMTVSGNATQSLTVNKVWTTDSNNTVKTSFAPGNAIRYWVQVTNPNSATVTATFTFAATGPQKIFSWSGSGSAPSGTYNYYYPTTVPTTAPAGTYTLTVKVTYNGVTSKGQSTFRVATSKAVWCQCTTYVANHYGLPATYPDAKDWPGWLKGLGWKHKSAPSVGDIVVFQPAFGSGIDQKHGHVGIITVVQSVNNNLDWHITVEGSNQGTTGLYTKDNCTNVSNIQFKAYPKTDTSVSYWAP